MPSNALKRALSAVPVLGPTLRKIYHYHRTSVPHQGSAGYWERRYARGGNSGPGSYGRLAEFKAQVLNDFVQKHDIRTIIELGCGDGAQLMRAQYPFYVGIDVSASAIAQCQIRFASDSTKSFYHSSERVKYGGTYEVALSLDVIYHLTEDDVYNDYMVDLFRLPSRYVIIYSSNYDSEPPVKHIRHRKFSRWIVANAPDWQFVETIKNFHSFDPNDSRNTSFADFYIYERH